MRLLYTLLVGSLILFSFDSIAVNWKISVRAPDGEEKVFSPIAPMGQPYTLPTKFKDWICSFSETDKEGEFYSFGCSPKKVVGVSSLIVSRGCLKVAGGLATFNEADRKNQELFKSLEDINNKTAFTISEKKDLYIIKIWCE